MKIYNMESCDDDDCQIRVFIPGPPGPPGPPLTDVGTRSIPVLITTSISAPVNRRQRSFIAGSSGPIINPTIPNPPDNGAWELFLFCTDNTKTITLEDQSNLQLSGQWIGANGSILCLQWDGASKYVEEHRNEI
jgi:hypothetical protein